MSFMSAICISLILVSVCVCYAEVDNSDIKSVIIYDKTFETYIFKKEPSMKIYPASITKVMTALLVLENTQDLDVKVTASINAVSQNREGGSTTDIKAGEELTYAQLLDALLIKSGNEVAYILAEAVSGTIEDFVALMNQKALMLGLSGTHFVNPCGLQEEDHYSTAYDIIKLARYAMKNEIFAGIVSKKILSLPPTNIHEEEGWADSQNTNLLLTDEKYLSDNFTVTGIKTGTTPFSGYCLLSSVMLRTGSELYGVVLGAPDEDTLYSYNRSLYDTILEYYEEKLLFKTDEIFAFLKYKDGSVPLYPGEDIKVYVPKNFPLSDLTVKTVPYNDSSFPVMENDVLGRIDVMLDDKVLVSYSLVSHVSVGDIVEGSTAESMTETDAAAGSESGVYSTDEFAVKVLLIFSSTLLVLIIFASIYNTVVKKNRSRRRKSKWEDHLLQK